MSNNRVWWLGRKYPAHVDGGYWAWELAKLAGFYSVARILASGDPRFGRSAWDSMLRVAGALGPSESFYDMLDADRRVTVADARKVLPVFRSRARRPPPLPEELMPSEERTRDERIAAAMRSYSGPRTKWRGWPYLRCLRRHAGMPISAADRKRVWRTLRKSRHK